MASTSGCLGDLRNIVGRRRLQQLSLTVGTLPASEDPYAVRIANRLVSHLEAAGIDAIVDPIVPDELLRDVLVNHDFDIYVMRYPSEGNSDELRSMLHSDYTEEAGWQNPFGYTNLGMDELLDDQRSVPAEDRQSVLHEIQREFIREQPFTVVAFADRINAYRTDRFDGWRRGGPDKPTDYLRLQRTGETETIDLLLRDTRITRNRNPIAAEHRERGTALGLLYEPLARHIDGEIVPWLARTIDWEKTTSDGADGVEENSETLNAAITLRDANWHDGEPVTADDVVFSYDFLSDTSLGTFDSPVPTPWRRGRLSLVDDVRIIDDDQLRVSFSTANRNLAFRGLSSVILPEHIWDEQSDSADLAGIDIIGQTTEALVWANEEPVGSGPLKFVDATPDDELVVEAFDDHFLESNDTEGIPEPYDSGPPFDRAVFTVTPSHDAAVQLLQEDEADGTADGLQASVVPRVARNSELSLSVTGSESFYHVGYNCREAPMSNPRFRQVLAQLIDREYLVENSFGGYARAAQVPFGGEWAPASLQWDGDGELPFLGENGTLDIEAAQDAFRDAGYQYDDGRLIRRGDS